MLLRYDQDVPCDYEQAMKWHRMAAEQGYLPALTNLGQLAVEWALSKDAVRGDLMNC
jgi:TPR repeat protein